MNANPIFNARLFGFLGMVPIGITVTDGLALWVGQLMAIYGIVPSVQSAEVANRRRYFTNFKEVFC